MRTDEPGALIYSALRSALYPFLPNEVVSLALVPDADLNQDLLIEFRDHPGLLARFPLSDLDESDIYAFYDELARRIFEHYRNLTRVDPEPNIILSEN